MGQGAIEQIGADQDVGGASVVRAREVRSADGETGRDAEAARLLLSMSGLMTATGTSTVRMVAEETRLDRVGEASAVSSLAPSTLCSIETTRSPFQPTSASTGSRLTLVRRDVGQPVRQRLPVERKRDGSGTAVCSIDRLDDELARVPGVERPRLAARRSTLTGSARACSSCAARRPDRRRERSAASWRPSAARPDGAWRLASCRSTACFAWVAVDDRAGDFGHDRDLPVVDLRARRRAGRCRDRHRPDRTSAFKRRVIDARRRAECADRPESIARRTRHAAWASSSRPIA